MIELDPRTLPLATALIFLLMAGAMALLGRAAPGDRCARYWAWGNVSIALGVLFIALRGMVSPFLTFPVANTLVVSGEALLLAGIWSFYNRPVSWRVLAGIALGIFLAIVLFTYVVPDLSARIVVGSLFIAAVAGWATRVLIREYDPQLGLPQLLVTGVFALYALFMVVRAGMTVQDAPEQTAMLAEPVHAIAFLLAVVSIISLTFGFSAMINRRLHLHLHHIASHDQLTGSYSRRGFEEMVDRELSRSRRLNSSLSVLLMDVDHFKRINDAYGHVVGDRVLRSVVDAVHHVLRAEDVLGRIGGEEFCVLLPNANRDSALTIAERVRGVVDELIVEHDGRSLGVTVSIGVTTLAGGMPEWDQVFTEVDSALYRAKESGRNRVAC